MTCIRCKHTFCKKFGRFGKAKIQRYRCQSCCTTFSEATFEPHLGDMRIDAEAAVRAVQCLLEGCSIRSTERLTGLNRNTIMSLLVLAGKRCEKIMDSRMRELPCKFVQLDELWSFVGKKQKQVRANDPIEECCLRPVALHIALWGGPDKLPH